jgi:chromate transporter
VLGRLWEVLFVATRLGLTSFGGPVAHLGYFRAEYVERRKWLTEQTYADLVALCQLLPGPASSQVGIGVGIKRAGLLGGILAWIGFTLPSAAVLILFTYGVAQAGDVSDAAWLAGLKVVAVSVVALAVWGMARTLTPDRNRITLAIVAAIFVTTAGGVGGQVIAIVGGGLLGWIFFRRGLGDQDVDRTESSIGRRLAIASLVVFAVLLVGLPIMERVFDSGPLQVFDSFYRSGSLVFGGGHVVLPLLQAETVPTGMVSQDEFIAGYGAAQAVPGPLFTFAAYLGGTAETCNSPWLGGFFALGAIYLPSFLLVVGVLPFWDAIRSMTGFRSVLIGVNAAVVGLLLAALYDPVWTSAIHQPSDFALGLAAFGLLAFWKIPPWIVVVLSAVGAEGIEAARNFL